MKLSERFTNWLRASGDDSRLTFSADIDVEARSGDNERPRVTMRAYSGGVMNIAGMGNVVVDLGGMTIPKQLNLLADHRAELDGIIGTAEPRKERGALVATGELTLSTEAGRTVRDLARDSVSFQASIGASTARRRFIREGEVVNVNGRNIQAEAGGFTLIERSTLREISVLPLGADANTTVNIAAHNGDSNMTFEQWLTANGWERDKLSEAQLSSLEAAYNARNGGGGNGGGTATATDDPVQAERQRQANVMRVTASHPQIQAKALAEGWTVQQAELEALKAGRPQVGGLYLAQGASGAGGASERDIAAAGLMLLCGYEDGAGKIAGGRAAQAARDMRLNDLRAWNDFNAHLTGEAETSVKAGFSSASLSVLMDSIPKMVLEEFEQALASVDALAAWRPLADFKEASIYRLLALGGGLEEVGGDGQIKHGRLEEFDTRIKLGTYAKMFGITRKTLINDDVQAIAGIPRIITQEASRLRGEKFAELLANNPSDFFGSGNANDITDELNFNGLDAAIVKMRTQQDEDKRALNLQPTALVVHPAKEATAASLLESMELSRDASGDNLPTGNPMRRRNLRLEVEPRLSTEDEWYLFSRPGDGAVVIGTLNGQQAPSVEMSDADFNTLGEQVRGYYDFAVALAEPRAAVRSTGTGNG